MRPEVPGFEPITKPEQLPAEGTTVETLSRDFKKLVAKGPTDRAELAKDVAAFANRIGGTILIGAAEDRKRGVLGRYQTMGAVEAAEVRKACSEAVRDFCSPQPLFEPDRIPKDGGFVIALNVRPFPGQAVGVRRAGDSDAYAFPMRTGMDCVFLRPEQLPMLMIPELRRVVALLYTIPTSGQVTLHQTGGPRQTFRLLAVDEVKNVVVLQYPPGAGIQSPFNVALDSLASVWCDESGVWQLLRN
jgi:hypothetical protein